MSLVVVFLPDVLKLIATGFLLCCVSKLLELQNSFFCRGYPPLQDGVLKIKTSV